MLGKLIKHEFKATCKSFFLLFLALIGMTILTRLFQAIPSDNTVCKIIRVLFTIGYVILIVGLTFFGVIIMLRRFNNNLLRDEGYLTHTLPVKMWQHLTAKMFTDTVWIIASVAVMFLSFTIFFVGTEPFDIVPEAFTELGKIIKTYPLSLLMIIEFIITCIMAFVTTMMNIFAALSLGQIFNQHKIAGSVLFYFVLNTAMGFISLIVFAYMPVLVNRMDRMDKVLNSLTASFHHKTEVFTNNMMAFLLFYIVIMLVETIIFSVITNYMLSKKLNLE